MLIHLLKYHELLLKKYSIEAVIIDIPFQVNTTFHYSILIYSMLSFSTFFFPSLHRSFLFTNSASYTLQESTLRVDVSWDALRPQIRDHIYYSSGLHQIIIYLETHSGYKFEITFITVRVRVELFSPSNNILCEVVYLYLLSYMT